MNGDEIRHRNRAREKDRVRHNERREANATEPSAVFEPASDEDVTIEAVYRDECANQDGLRLVDFDGKYTTISLTQLQRDVMANLIKEVRRPHDCHGEFKRELGDLDLWPGSIADCSCGKRFELRDSQRDGLYWSEMLADKDPT